MLINTSHNVPEILQDIVEESCKALGCESARIAMREGDNWVIRFINALPEELVGRSFTDEELPHAALAMLTKKPVAIDDAFHDMRTNTGMMKELGMKSVLVLPLMVKEQVIGILSFGYHTEPVSFTESEIDYAEKVSIGVAIALHNARLYEYLQKSEKEVAEAKKLGDALIDIDALLYSRQSYDDVMKGMLHLATKAIGAETSIIFEREDDRWMTRYVYKLSESLVGRSFSNSEVLHTAITADTKKHLIVHDAAHSRDVDQKYVEMLGIRSLLDFPLIVHGEVIGDLTFHYHSGPVNFNERQVEFVRKLQNSISLGLENARLINAERKSESRLKEAEKLGKSGYFHYDILTRKTTWSEGMFSIFGRDPALGEPTVEEFFQSYSVEPGMNEMKEIVKVAGATEFDARIKRNSNQFDVHITLQTHEDGAGSLQGLFGTIQEITERKRAEQQLNESKIFIQTILDSLPAHIVVLDQQGIIMDVNDSWKRFAEENGLADAQTVCAGADYLAVCRKATEMYDPLALEALTGIEGVLREEQSEFTLNYPCHSPTVQRWFMMKVVRWNHGLKGAVITHLDITDQIKAENQIQEANRELETFNYTVAHDLRKPLTVINGYCQALKELCSDNLDEECRSYLNEAYDGTWRMNQLIDALLNFSQVTRAEPKREPIDLCILAEEVVTELRQAEPERRVIFNINNGLKANADRGLIKVVLANLLGNAWKYTSTREEGVIEFGATEIAGNIVFFVKDNGLGFDMADADKLFTPFQRLSAQGEIGGIGIGLATVDKVIKRHGGKIWAEGEPDKGATFYFTL